MATAALTKRTIDALKSTPGCDYFVWDARLKGFGVRVTERVDESGVSRSRKVFVLGYRHMVDANFEGFRSAYMVRGRPSEHENTRCSNYPAPL